MQSKTGVFLIFLLGLVVGLLFSLLEPVWVTLPLLSIVAIIIIVLLIVVWLGREKRQKPTYDEVAVELYNAISRDVDDIRAHMENIKLWQLRQQLGLICDDITILLDKVAEKSPQSRLTAGKFVRGHLDFIINDILPQYIEMQDTPRYYDSPADKMDEGHQAIRIFGTFLHNRIVQLEIADDMRYAVAIEMLKTLNAYAQDESIQS